MDARTNLIIANGKTIVFKAQWCNKNETVSSKNELAAFFLCRKFGVGVEDTWHGVYLDLGKYNDGG